MNELMQYLARMGLNPQAQAAMAVAFLRPTTSRPEAGTPDEVNDQGIRFEDAYSAMLKHLQTKYRMSSGEADHFARTFLRGTDTNSQAFRKEALQHLTTTRPPEPDVKQIQLEQEAEYRRQHDHPPIEWEPDPTQTSAGEGPRMRRKQ